MSVFSFGAGTLQHGDRGRLGAVGSFKEQRAIRVGICFLGLVGGMIGSISCLMKKGPARLTGAVVQRLTPNGCFTFASILAGCKQGNMGGSRNIEDR